RRNRSSRPVRFFPMPRDDQSRPTVALDNSRSRDPNHPAMPAFPINDDAVRVTQPRLFFKTEKNAVHDAPFCFLPVRIQFIETARNLARTLYVFLVEKIHHIASHIHASRGVQPRRNSKR